MASLADLQRAPGTVASGPPALPLRVERVRTFETPEFDGMQFLEVETKSALNRVKGMPFQWSINPYRGCSHACRYCAGGETPVLTADGRTKQLADLRKGDAIYGTVRDGPDRRYVVTQVLDHWKTLKRAYKVLLEDGTRLVTSGDHRFLTDRGWKHVTSAEQGGPPRAHLTCDSALIGTGAFASPPKVTPDYRRGYLSGVVRDDGTLFSPAGQREGLRRAHEYLTDLGVRTREFGLRHPSDTRRQVDAIAASPRGGVAAARGLLALPTCPTSDWSKGFLAGIFDAEGTCGPDGIRISDSDDDVIDTVTSALTRFGFTFVLEEKQTCRVVRLLGGLRERLRFFHTTDPAITRKRTIDGLALQSDASLRVVQIQPLGFEVPLYDITTGTGDYISNGVVSHNCFARPTHAYLNLSPLGDFERTIVVKTNLVEVLRRELARPSWRGEHVAMGTNTDNYQRCEGRYRLMPGIIGALAGARTPFSILTKGTLITRDAAALADAAEQVPVAAAFTVGMLDDRLWRSSEPGTPSPRARLDAVRTLSDAGIPTGVMLAPIMPGLNDDREQLDALVDAAVAAGATHVTPIVLHLRPGVREVFWPWLQAEHPELVTRYAGLYRRSETPKAYRDEIKAFVASRRAAAWRRHGRPRETPRRGNSTRPPPPSGPEQLRLL